jgi:hypothetical protein
MAKKVNTKANVNKNGKGDKKAKAKPVKKVESEEEHDNDASMGQGENELDNVSDASEEHLKNLQERTKGKSRYSQVNKNIEALENVEKVVYIFYRLEYWCRLHWTFAMGF